MFEPIFSTIADDFLRGKFFPEAGLMFSHPNKIYNWVNKVSVLENKQIKILDKGKTNILDKPNNHTHSVFQ